MFLFVWDIKDILNYSMTVMCTYNYNYFSLFLFIYLEQGRSYELKTFVYRKMVLVWIYCLRCDIIVIKRVFCFSVFLHVYIFSIQE